MTSRTRERRLSLGNRIAIGVLGGIVCGIFFGELSSSLHVVGKVYVGLLEMTVLPYVAVSLIMKIGGLTFGDARRLAGRAGLVLLAFWGLALGTVLLLPLSLPEWKSGTFFSDSLVKRPESFDFLELYVPSNPFRAFAENVVPAAVLFSIAVGVALIGVAGKQRLLEPLEVLGDALSRISHFVVGLSPWGTFALTAGAAGTFSPIEMIRTAGYVSTFTVAALLLTVVVLPGFVAAITPFRLRELLAGFRDAGLTAFATGKLFAVLPIVMSDVKQLLVRRGLPAEEATAAADVYVPLAYPFPNAGRILSLLFIPFVGWFVGRPIDLVDYPLFLSVGLLALFGSPVAAIPYLLDLMRQPSDLLPLFLVAGIWCGRLGDVLGAMQLTAFTVTCAAWRHGWMRLRPARLGMWLAYVAPTVGLALVANWWFLHENLKGQEPPKSLVVRMSLLDELASIEVDVQASPNPHGLREGETRLERIRSAGEMRVGYLDRKPPFCYRNERGALVGLDVDLVQRLAHDLGVGLRLVPYKRGDVRAAFARDHFDLAIGGIASSIDNFEVYHESIPYLDLHVALLVPDYRVREFESLEGITRAEGLRIGYASDGYFARARQHRFPGVTPVELPSLDTYVNGEVPDVDAVLTTAENGAVLAMLYPSFSVVVPEGAKARVPIVFALQLADDLNRLVDTWVRLKQEDGTLDELYSHWILGERATEKEPRWSVVRDVLGWVE